MIKITKTQVNKAISELIGLRVKLFVTLDMLTHMEESGLEEQMIHMIMADVDDILRNLGFDADVLPERFKEMANFLSKKDYKELRDVLNNIGEYNMDEWLYDSSKDLIKIFLVFHF